MMIMIGAKVEDVAEINGEECSVSVWRNPFPPIRNCVVPCLKAKTFVLRYCRCSRGKLRLSSVKLTVESEVTEFLQTVSNRAPMN